jgi:hypothetical protein
MSNSVDSMAAKKMFVETVREHYIRTLHHHTAHNRALNRIQRCLDEVAKKKVYFQFGVVHPIKANGNPANWTPMDLLTIVRADCLPTNMICCTTYNSNENQNEMIYLPQNVFMIPSLVFKQ